jgi:signal transduction histidine kinase
MKKFQIIKTSLFVFLLLFSTTIIKAQKTSSKNKQPDKDLTTYYLLCKEKINSEQVISMSNILYKLAEGKKDKVMQGNALMLRLDYYYKSDNTHMIIELTNEVKSFAKSTKQPDFYYFAWSKRLIKYFIKGGQLENALYETRLMLHEAQKSTFRKAKAYCYSSLAAIYHARNLDDFACEDRLKELSILESLHETIEDISNEYAFVAIYYIQNNQISGALQMLKKAFFNAHTIPQKFLVQCVYASMYTQLNDFKLAADYLRDAKLLLNENPDIDISTDYYFVVAYRYYFKTKDYTKALSILEQWQNRMNKNDGVTDNRINRFYAELYSAMNNNILAIKYFNNFVQANDSLQAKEAVASLNELSALLDVEQLNNEKNELVMKGQEDDLDNRKIIIGSLALLLFICVIFFAYEKRLNLRLNIADYNLQERNTQLELSHKNLKKAKERAEVANKMKTEFIQSMTHEIRTPLNQIVGFSQVLIDQFTNEKENKEYVSIIDESSKNLMRLVDDLLNISDLELLDKLATNIPCYLDSCCQTSVDQARSTLHEGVSINFIPHNKNTMIMSNPERIAQVLSLLVHNATKFTEKGRIVVDYAIHEEKKIVDIYVTDTGIGIPTDKQEKIFEKFYKINDFTQGTGLGLPIAQLIATKLGGILTLDTKYTKGSRFVMTLPWVKARIQ